MSQAEGITALLQYLMEKDERERRERESKEEERAKAEKKKEANRLEFEIKRLDLDRELHNKKSRQAACQQLKHWDDNTDPIAYLDNFELVMKEAMISQNEWVNLIRKQLTGKVPSAFQEEAIEVGTPYHVFRSTMLERMGAIADKARRTIWLAKLSMEEGPEILLRRVLRAITMLKEKLDTPEAAAQEIFQGFLHQLFTGCYWTAIEQKRHSNKVRLSRDSGRPRTSMQGGGCGDTIQTQRSTPVGRSVREDTRKITQDQPPKESEPLSNRGTQEIFQGFVHQLFTGCYWTAIEQKRHSNKFRLSRDSGRPRTSMQGGGCGVAGPLGGSGMVKGVADWVAIQMM